MAFSLGETQVAEGAIERIERVPARMEDVTDLDERTRTATPAVTRA